MLGLIVNIARAFFDDHETMSDVSYQVATLVLDMEETNTFDTPLQENATASQVVSASPAGTMETQYQVHATGINGTLCNYLIVTANKNGFVPEYAGPLLGLTVPGELINDIDYWTFDYSSNNWASEMQNQTCEFDLVFEAWQSDISEFGNGGFFHLVIISNLIITGEWSEPELKPELMAINEIMWMGSTVSPHDEWIELKNLTNQPLDITGWTLENVLNNSKALLTIPPSVVPPYGYYLISRLHPVDPSSALNILPHLISPDLLFFDNGNQHIKLRDQDGFLIDHARAMDWPAGIDDLTKHSMQRLDPMQNGMKAESWASCVDQACNDTRYWDVEGDDYGTPNAPNLFGQEIPGHGNVTIIDTFLTPINTHLSPINASSTSP